METNQNHRIQRSSGELVRARSTVICIAASAVLGLVSMAGVPTILAQIASMDPNSVPAVERERRARVTDGALLAQRRGRVVQQVIDEMYRRRDAVPSVDRLAELDSDNGLYQHLFLLSQLRQQAPTTQPDSWERMQNAIVASEAAAPARLYHQAMQREVDAALVRSGVNPREAAAVAQRTIDMFLQEQHRPVIRELSDRLLQWAEVLKAGGRLEEARRVNSLAARILLELVNESPTDDVTLLAAERLPRAMDAIGRIIKERGDAGTAAKAQVAAQAVAALPKDWHAAARDEDINIIPFSGGLVANLAYSAQRELLGTFTRTLVLAVSYALLFALFVPLALIWAATPSARAVPLTWRGGLGPALGCVIALLPLILLLGVTFVGRLSFTWIFTAQSGLALILFLLLYPLAIGVAARLAIRFPEPLERHRIPPLAIWVGPVVILLLLVGLNLAYPSVRSPRRPPLLVQYFRKELIFAGLIAAVLTPVWFLVGQIRRVRGRIPIGLTARSQFAVLAQALLIVAVVMPLMLLANTRHDAAHQKTYAIASQDVFASQLGSAWKQRYFGPVGTIVSSSSSVPAP